jgi:hypothetical protein
MRMIVSNDERTTRTRSECVARRTRLKIRRTYPVVNPFPKSFFFGQGRVWQDGNPWFSRVVRAFLIALLATGTDRS